MASEMTLSALAESEYFPDSDQEIALKMGVSREGVEIARLMGIAGDGIALGRTDPNPFRFKHDAIVSDNPVAHNLESAVLDKQRRSLTLFERSETKLPKLPGCVTRATRVVREGAASSMASDRPVKERRRPLMSEFIEEKREVYLFQLMIDRKAQEVERFRKEAAASERRVREREQAILDDLDAIKRTGVQLEASLAKIRMRAETAAQERVAFSKKLKHVETGLALTRSTISKNEDTLETYRPYGEFLERVIPLRMTFEEFCKDPESLVDDLHRLENENLFVITHCRRLEGYLDHIQEAGEMKVDHVMENEKEVIDRIAQMIAEDETRFCMSQEQSQAQVDSDIEVADLKSAIRGAYKKCFLTDADITAISMLERIENELEHMYDMCDRVAPQFLTDKQLAKDRERRDKQRKDWHHQRECEQMHKMEHAIERACKPIPYNAGRRLCPRILPVRVQKTNDALIEQQLREAKEEEVLLFAPPGD